MCAVCVMKLVCVRVIQFCLYLAFGGEGDEYVCAKNSITGQKKC